jgi:hypothetical protein
MRPHLCPTYYVYHLVLYLQTSHRSARVKSCAKHATAIHASVPWSPDQSWCPFRASRMNGRGLIFEIHIPPISYPHDCIKGRQVLSVPLRCPQDPQRASSGEHALKRLAASPCEPPCRPHHFLGHALHTACHRTAAGSHDGDFVLRHRCVGLRPCS